MLVPAVQEQQQVRPEQIEGLNRRSRTNLIRFKSRFQVNTTLKTTIKGGGFAADIYL